MPTPAAFELASETRFDDIDVLELDDDVPELAGEMTRTEASFGELGELRTWQRLIDLAECAGKTRLAAAFRCALDEERR